MGKGVGLAVGKGGRQVTGRMIKGGGRARGGVKCGMRGKGEKWGRLRVMKGFRVVKGLMVWGRIKGGEKGEGSRLRKRGRVKVWE